MNDHKSDPFLEALKPFPCYGGLDLAAVSDLTSFGLAWPINDYVYVHPWFWIPEEELAERVKRDNVPYDAWHREGYIELTPGPVTDWQYVTDRVKTLASQFDIKSIGFDRWGARDTVGDLAKAGIVVEDVGQGTISMNAPSKRLQGLVLSRRLVHSGHPILRWNVDCTSVEQDAAGNIKPVKPNRQKGNKRIDGVLAIIMAIGRATSDGAIDAPAVELW